MRRLALLFLTLLVGAAGARAQDAHAADHGSIDAIVAALYGTISGPEGQVRDTARFLDLFQPGAQLCAMVKDSTGRSLVVYRQLRTFIAGVNRFTQAQGFFETEVARRTESWGGLTHVWSTYESRFQPEEAPFARGINSIQLFHDGTRWWIANITWTDESTGTPLPKRYLKGIR
jgi:hypothetical protein